MAVNVAVYVLQLGLWTYLSLCTNEDRAHQLQLLTVRRAELFLGGS